MTDEGCVGNGRGTGQAHTSDSCTPEIPQDASIAAAVAIQQHRGTQHRCACGFRYDSADQHAIHRATLALAAALPHLLTEVKSMCETATKVGIALGRQEALEEMAGRCERRVTEIGSASKGVPMGDERWTLTGLARGWDLAGKLARNLSSRAQEATSNGLTASSRHPGTPEDTKPPQEAS